MYLSQIKLDMAKRETLIAFRNLQRFHGAVAHAFEDYKNCRPLWRIDTLRGERILLVLGRDIPNLASIVNQFGYLGQTDAAVTKDYRPFLEKIENGSTWNFRLTANPVTTLNGHRVPHITPSTQAKWLTDRASKNGFDVCYVNIIGSKQHSIQRGGGSKTKSDLMEVTYNGVLTVTDKEQFVNILKTGIGHSKAYGMGMLTVVHPNTVS